MIENLVYGFTILLLLAQLIISREKPFALLVLSHAVLQYVYTLLSWHLRLGPGVALATLGFILATTLLLIWARKMHYGTNEQRMARTMINTLQWSFLGALILFSMLRSPDWYEFSVHGGHPDVDIGYVSLHPVIKIAGNYFIFALFSQVILRWGLRWKMRESMINIGPFAGYVLLILLLLIRQATFSHHPYT
jgi:uncharacterized MnhB-related membrane protein